MAGKSSKGRERIVVIGTSAGGLQALSTLLRQLPTTFSSPIFVVQHLSPESSGSILAEALQRNTSHECRVAKNGDRIQNRRVVIAPPDHHMLLKRGHVLVTKGARENRSRPSIDPTFRSAAVAYGPQVIGLILTGSLDDGTAGLAAVQSCGGIGIVQDPASATYPDMPQSVLDNLKVNFCVPLDAIGGLLQRLIAKRPPRPKAIPEEVKLEAKIAERVLSDVNAANRLGRQVPYNCPNCGGVLWQITKSKEHRYRCHTGHSFTAANLEAIQLEKIEETLWICLRMLEERKNLLNSTSVRERERGFAKAAGLMKERAREASLHIERIRDILRTSTKAMAVGIRPRH
jgi:two-component system chemotaxis response regulator CheB